MSLPILLTFRSKENQAPMLTDVVALDPDIRTFMAGYSCCGQMLQVGKGATARICRLPYALDWLHSEWAQLGINRKKIYHMTKAGARISA